MKIRFWDRLLVAFCGLLILLLSVGLFVFGIGVFPFRLDVSMLNGPFELWQRAMMVAAALVLCALGLHSIWMLLRRGREKGFIIQHTEFGDMSISMHAMENMVKKCVDSHQELTVNATRIHRGREGIVVDIKITLLSGVNIPLTVNALQKQIKQYITSCSGVDVQEVRVMVETNAAVAACPEPAQACAADVPKGDIVSDEPGQKPRESFAHRIFRHTEEPQSYTASLGEAAVVPMEPEKSEPVVVDAVEPQPPVQEVSSLEPEIHDEHVQEDGKETTGKEEEAD